MFLTPAEVQGAGAEDESDAELCAKARAAYGPGTIAVRQAARIEQLAQRVADQESANSRMAIENIKRCAIQDEAKAAAIRLWEQAAKECEEAQSALSAALWRVSELERERDALKARLDALKWELSADATEEQKAAFELSRRCVGLRSGSV